MLFERYVYCGSFTSHFKGYSRLVLILVDIWMTWLGYDWLWKVSAAYTDLKYPEKIQQQMALFFSMFCCDNKRNALDNFV